MKGYSEYTLDEILDVLPNVIDDGGRKFRLTITKMHNGWKCEYTDIALDSSNTSGGDELSLHTVKCVALKHAAFMMLGWYMKEIYNEDKHKLLAQLEVIDNDRTQLIHQYCWDHNPHKLDEVIATSSGGFIRVDKIRIETEEYTAAIIYEGHLCESDGTPLDTGRGEAKLILI